MRKGIWPENRKAYLVTKSTLVYCSPLQCVL